MVIRRGSDGAEAVQDVAPPVDRGRHGILHVGRVPASGAKIAIVALILAVDVSGSVDEEEYAIQRDGLARALADSVVRVLPLGLQALRGDDSLPWTWCLTRMTHAGEGSDAALRRLQRAVPHPLA